MRFLVFCTYYFITPFLAALIARALLPDFPDTESKHLLLWTFIALATVPALVLMAIYAGIFAKKQFSHPLARLHHRSQRRTSIGELSEGESSVTLKEEYRKTSRRASRLNL